MIRRKNETFTNHAVAKQSTISSNGLEYYVPLINTLLQLRQKEIMVKLVDARDVRKHLW